MQSYKNDSLALREYGERAYSLAIYPKGESMASNLTYPVLGLNGEAGEVAEKLKKIIRDGSGEMPQAKRDEIIAELGDVLWYVNACAREVNSTLEEVAGRNLDKLFSRKERDVLHGDGDNR